MGYGWGYRGWGPPYPQDVQRRRGARATAIGVSTTFNHQPWGWGGDFLWIVLFLRRLLGHCVAIVVPAVMVELAHELSWLVLCSANAGFPGDSPHGFKLVLVTQAPTFVDTIDESDQTINSDRLY